jgi:hypothetical protein
MSRAAPMRRRFIPARISRISPFLVGLLWLAIGRSGYLS